MCPKKAAGGFVGNQYFGELAMKTGDDGDAHWQPATTTGENTEIMYLSPLADRAVATKVPQLVITFNNRPTCRSQLDYAGDSKTKSPIEHCVSEADDWPAERDANARVRSRLI